MEDGVELHTRCGLAKHSDNVQRRRQLGRYDFLLRGQG